MIIQFDIHDLWMEKEFVLKFSRRLFVCGNKRTICRHIQNIIINFFFFEIKNVFNDLWLMYYALCFVCIRRIKKNENKRVHCTTFCYPSKKIIQDEHNNNINGWIMERNSFLLIENLIKACCCCCFCCCYCFSIISSLNLEIGMKKKYWESIDYIRKKLHPDSSQYIVYVDDDSIIFNLSNWLIIMITFMFIYFSSSSFRIHCRQTWCHLSMWIFQKKIYQGFF